MTPGRQVVTDTVIITVPTVMMTMMTTMAIAVAAVVAVIMMVVHMEAIAATMVAVRAEDGKPRQ